MKRALQDGAPLVHADVPNNLAAHFIQTSGDPDAAFARAEHFTKIEVQVDRSTAAPMECRAVAARWDAVSGELTVWDGTQAPISVRGGLASIFNLDEDKVRVIAPDVGGGFGQKVLLFYPDELLVPMAAMQLGRPVKYIEDRRENFIGSSHERTQIHAIELAALKTGEVIGLRDSFLHDTGAFIPYGIAVAQVASTSIAGPYRIPNIWVEFKAVYTPTVQVTPYRGCGRPQACFAIERAMDQLAEELGIDRFEIRRRNFISEKEFPYPREGLLFADGLKVTLDSGQYGKALGMAVDALGGPKFRVEQEKARAEGKYLGLGLACYVEGTGLGPYEGGHIRIHPITGKVYVNTGLSTPRPRPRHRICADRRRPGRRLAGRRDCGRRRYQSFRLGRRHVCQPRRGGERQRHPQSGADGAAEGFGSRRQYAGSRHRRNRSARLRGLDQRLEPLRAAGGDRDREQSAALRVQ